MEETQTPSTRREIITFLLLIGVCVVVVLVVAHSRRLICNQIVPAVMGEGLSEPADATDMTIDETDAGQTPADSENVDAADAATEEEEMDETAVEEATSTEEAVEESEGETAVSDEKTHTVQAGDTVYSIARKYNVTVEEIAKANNLADVNRVTLGQTLIIPQP
ncbi:MAG: LysM domain-containing protein [Chloroflexi bacterium]|nr:MAG: LysM domain-containing protein [Chloroflexota bacterium]